MSVAPGALFAVGVRLIASLLFAAYVAGFVDLLRDLRLASRVWSCS